MDDLPENALVQHAGQERQPQLRVTAADIHHRRQPGDQHGNGCRQGHACHVHMEEEDEDQVQHDVHHAGDEQEGEGRAAVANAAQNTGVDVVAQIAQGAQEEDPHIADRMVPGLRRHLHEPEQQRAEENAQHRQRNSRQVQKAHRILNQRTAFFQGAAAGILARQDGDARAHAHEQAQEDLDGLAAGAYRRQGLGAAVPAHHQGIHRAVELLEDIAQHDGQRKQQGIADDRALSHVDAARSSHEKTSLVGQKSQAS